MYIAANGIVIDQYGDVLLAQRDDTKTLAPPGRAVALGEVASETAVQAVRDTSGLIVMAVRLAGLFFWPEKPDGYLFLCFRCIMRGGVIAEEDGEPQAGFFNLTELSAPMLPLHEEQVQRTLYHKGGRPYWGRQSSSLSMRLRNLFGVRQASWAEEPTGPAWQTQVTSIIRNDAGGVLWLQQGGGWRLPGGAGAEMEPPWETAVRTVREQLGCEVQLTHLSGVYPQGETAQMAFAFTADVMQSATTPQAAAAWFAAGSEPAGARPAHVAQVADAFSRGAETHFRLQEVEK